MGLTEKYEQAIRTARNHRLQGPIQEQNGKLVMSGTVRSLDDKNRIWDAIKTNPDWQREVIADIRIQPAESSAGGSLTYTVRSGDTLSKIAKEQLGDGNAYQEIFEANRDQLSDPDKIKPGQVLKIPVSASR